MPDDFVFSPPSDSVDLSGYMMGVGLRFIVVMLALVGLYHLGVSLFQDTVPSPVASELSSLARAKAESTNLRSRAQEKRTQERLSQEARAALAVYQRIKDEEAKAQEKSTEEVREEDPQENPENYNIAQVLSHDGGVLIWRDDGEVFFHRGGERYHAPSFGVVGWSYEEAPKQLATYPFESKGGLP